MMIEDGSRSEVAPKDSNADVSGDLSASFPPILRNSLLIAKEPLT